MDDASKKYELTDSDRGRLRLLKDIWYYCTQKENSNEKKEKLPNTKNRRRFLCLKLASCSGLPDGICFQTKNSNLGKFSRALDWKKWIYFMAIGNILRTFGIFYDHLVHFVLVSRTMKNLATLMIRRRKLFIPI
jgi:hypothetical protein